MSCALHHLSISKDAQTGVILVNLFAQNNFVKNMVYGNVHLIHFASRNTLKVKSAMSVLTEQQMSLIAQDFQLDLI